MNQVHGITNMTEKLQVCSTLYLEVGQMFDKVWHKLLVYKLNKILPKRTYNRIIAT